MDYLLSTYVLLHVTITTHKLSKRFNREWIFRNFSFEFTKGNTYAITGPNGSGKSTLLQVLWGQVPQTDGKLHYQKENADIPTETIINHISIATPYMDLIDEFTLQEQIEFHFKLKRIRANLSMQELLEIMYLVPAKDKYIGNFSSGMKQRLKLALAFYTEAELIFLDEPGTNLDEKAFAWYRNELEKLPHDTLIIIASNNPAEYPSSAHAVDMMRYKL